MTHTAPVKDWATDFDVLDPRYVADPFSIWDELRQTCPIAHTDRRRSSWLPTRYEDVTAIAHDIEHFSSLKVAVIPGDEDEDPPIRGPQPRVRAAAHLGRPAAAHLDAPAAAAVVLAQAGRQLRAADPRAVPRAASTGSPTRAAPTPPRTTPSRSRSGSSPTSSACRPDLSDTFTGWVRDVLEFADDAERRQHGAEGLLNYFIGAARGRGARTRATTC